LILVKIWSAGSARSVRIIDKRVFLLVLFNRFSMKTGDAKRGLHCTDDFTW
jgi:hypothetical protein